jgi:hypothetical protein
MHTFNVQITCDAFKNIVNIYHGSPGSFHDGRVFRRSQMYYWLTDGTICNGPSLVFNNNEIP